MNPTVYEAIWQDFASGDHITQAPIWGGAGLALVVPVEDPAVLAHISHIQTVLEARLPFSPHLSETLHITLHLFGLPTADSQAHLEEFLAAKTAKIPDFQVELRQLSSFFRAPFYEVHDGGALEKLMARIRPGLEELGFPGPDYGPRGQVFHVTLGAYTENNDGAAARRLLQDLRDYSAGCLVVKELRLVMASADAPYRLETLFRLLLAS